MNFPDNVTQQLDLIRLYSCFYVHQKPNSGFSHELANLLSLFMRKCSKVLN